MSTLVENETKTALTSLFDAESVFQAVPSLSAHVPSKVSSSGPTGTGVSKCRLNQIVQHLHGSQALHFAVITEEGPIHAPTFTCAAFLLDQELGRGRGSSKKSAEEAAAQIALTHKLVTSKHNTSILVENETKTVLTALFDAEPAHVPSKVRLGTGVAKCHLNQIIQPLHGSQALRFVVINEEGPIHAPTFTCAAFCFDQEIGRGHGSSKKSAEEAAARFALTHELVTSEKHNMSILIENETLTGSTPTLPMTEPMIHAVPFTHSKKHLNEIIQAHYPPQVLRFVVINQEGPIHAPTFTCAAFLLEQELGQGKGSSKKLAEEAAARIALTHELISLLVTPPCPKRRKCA